MGIPRNVSQDIPWPRSSHGMLSGVAYGVSHEGVHGIPSKR